MNDNDQECLNTYLDRLAKGEPAPPFGVDPGMRATVRHLNRLTGSAAPDRNLKASIWEDVMIHAELAAPRGAAIGPLFQPSSVGRLATLGRRQAPERIRARRRFGGELAAAAILLLTLAAGFVAYRTMPGNGGPPPTTPAMAAIQTESTPQPTIADCATEPRAVGTVTGLAGTEPIVAAFLPPFGKEPAPEMWSDREAIPVERFDNFAAADADTVAGVTATLNQLVACRFYAVNGNGDVDADGRFFALYNDDFFRRELANHPADQQQIPYAWWQPSTAPIVEDVRVTPDGRALAILTAADGPFPDGSKQIAIFVQVGDRWLVDELGRATEGGVVATPASLGTPEPIEIPETVVLEIALYDDLPGTPTWMTDEFAEAATVCDELTGASATPVAGSEPAILCGMGYARLGPWPYNELPADTQVTLRLQNTGSQPHRFVITELGVDVEVAPADTQEVVVTAPAGKYLLEIYEGAGAEPVGTGVFELIPTDGQFTLG